MFDLDGLLVDSEDAWGAAERRVVERLGHAWDPAIRTLLLGKGPVDAAWALAEHLGGVDVATTDRLLLDAAQEELSAGVVTRPGAAELLERLTREATPIGVATNSRRVLAELVLRSAGVADAVQVLVTADDVAAPKPSPDPYLEACRRLGVAAHRCVALEDSPVGVASAKAAGLWVIGCPSLPGVVLSEADATVASLAEVSVDGWFDARR